eukprot:jgi/Bigna1/90846/estExt_fgenesh1_pg.C_810022
MDYEARVKVQEVLRRYLKPTVERKGDNKKSNKREFRKRTRAVAEETSTETVEEIREKAIRDIKLICRKVNGAASIMFQILIGVLKDKDFQLRMHALDIIDVLFTRSKGFRLQILRDFHTILATVIGTKLKPLPLPKAACLREAGLATLWDVDEQPISILTVGWATPYALGRWYRLFGSTEGAMPLKRAYQYVVRVLQFEIPNAAAAAASMRDDGPQARTIRRNNLRALLLDRYVQLARNEGGLDSEIPNMCKTLTELKNAFALIIPDMTEVDSASHFNAKATPRTLLAADTQEEEFSRYSLTLDDHPLPTASASPTHNEDLYFSSDDDADFKGGGGGGRGGIATSRGSEEGGFIRDGAQGGENRNDRTGERGEGAPSSLNKGNSCDKRQRPHSASTLTTNGDTRPRGYNDDARYGKGLEKKEEDEEAEEEGEEEEEKEERYEALHNTIDPITGAPIPPAFSSRTPRPCKKARVSDEEGDDDGDDDEQPNDDNDGDDDGDANDDDNGDGRRDTNSSKEVREVRFLVSGGNDEATSEDITATLKFEDGDPRTPSHADDGGIDDELEEWGGSFSDDDEDEGESSRAAEKERNALSITAKEGNETDLQRQDFAYESARRLVGRGGARSSISLEIGNGRGGQFVEETPENRAVFDVVRDLRKVIEKQHLRQVSAWIRTLRNVAFPQRRPVPPLRSGVHIYGETAEKRRQELLSKAENIAQKLSVAQRQCRSLLGASSSPRTR